MKPLPKPDEVNRENVVEKFQQTLEALKSISGSLGTRDMPLAIQIKGLRDDMNQGLNRLENKIDTHLSEQNKILKMIAENTKP